MRAPIACAATLAALAAWPAATSPSVTPHGATQSPGSSTCYPGQFTGFRRSLTRPLYDPLAGRRRMVRISAPETVCVPAGSSTASGPYWTCHFTQPDGLPLERKFRTIAFKTVETVKALSPADVVCVESERVADGAGAGPAPSGFMICYRTAGTSRRTRVLVTDPFGTTTDLLGPLARVCATTSTRPSYLACYRVTSRARASSILLNTRFGMLRAALGGRSLFCLRAVAI
jgi:hypothetical protein